MVKINYFTKWVEAEPLSNIRDLDAKNFVGKNIVTLFGMKGPNIGIGQWVMSEDII